MSVTDTPESFLSLRRTASRLGIPAAWLRKEAQARRVPHLRIGRRLMFNPKVMERVLIERAGQQVEASDDAK